MLEPRAALHAAAQSGRRASISCPRAKLRLNIKDFSNDDRELVAIDVNHTPYYMHAAI